MTTIDIYYQVERLANGRWIPCVLKKKEDGNHLMRTRRRGLAHSVGRQTKPPARVVKVTTTVEKQWIT